MQKQIIVLVTLSVIALFGCHPKSAKNKEVKQRVTIAESPAVKEVHDDGREYVDRMTFVEYLDDGDYFQVVARKGDSTFSFVNNIDTSEKINRGDTVQLKWKNGTITLAGDNDSEMPAHILLSIKKTADGPVSEFRRTYGKKIKYTWADEDYTSTYLDKVYLIVEYYLTQTKNPLLRLAVKNQDELTYSIETKERDNRTYKMLGIAPVGPNGSNIVQWLFIDEESGKVYEYDLPEDRLVEFN